MKTILFGVLCGLALGCDKPSSPTPRTSSTPATTNSPTHADPNDRTNTAVNVRDRDGDAKTPVDQKENKEDIGITVNIRKRVVDAKMSVEAQNVKIITADGKVTLRGPVKTEEEKEAIKKIAADVAGADHVDSQLELAKE